MAIIWRERTDRYSELRSAQTKKLLTTGKAKIEMSYFGGQESLGSDKFGLHFQRASG